MKHKERAKARKKHNNEIDLPEWHSPNRWRGWNKRFPKNET